MAEQTEEKQPVAVTGVTGAVGGRVARLLAGAGVPVRLLAREPARAPQLQHAEPRRADYEQPATVAGALPGVRTLFLVSASEHPDRTTLHRGAVDAAVRAGVRRIVYLSFVNAGPASTFTFARDHWHTEEHIRRSGVAYTFLRDSLYADVLPYFAGRDGVIRGPAGDGRVGAVARDDVAEAATAVLQDDSHDSHHSHDGRTYDLTGPAALSLAGVAQELTRAAGRPVRYQAETLAEAYASRARFGAPDWEVAGWVSSYAAIATGELDLVTDDVARLTGHPPRSLTDVLAAYPESLRHLKPDQSQR